MNISSIKCKLEDFYEAYKKYICFIGFGILQFLNCFFIRFFLYDCFVVNKESAMVLFGIRDWPNAVVGCVCSIFIGGAMQFANIKLFEFLLLKLEVVNKKWYAGVITGTFLVTYVFLFFWMWIFNQPLLVWFCPILAYLTAMIIWTPTAIGKNKNGWYLK